MATLLAGWSPLRLFCPLAERVSDDSSGHTEFSVSENGVLAYQGSSAVNRRLIWVDRQGNQLGTIALPANYGGFRLSPDEKFVALGRPDAQTRGGDIWLLDLQRGIFSRFTSHPAYDWRPVWSPDGNRIVFGSNRDGPMNLYIKTLGGAASEQAILKSDSQKNPNDWSRDGQFILYDNLGPKANKHDLWALPLARDLKPFPLMQT